MAVAAKALGKKDRSHIAVIGDGAMTAGMVFEALNCAGDMKDLRLLVILNDNDCSISPPVGALKNHFTQLMSGQFYAQARDIGKAIVRPFPKLFDLTKRAEEYSKGMVAPHSTLFEEFGMNYHGPIDGHDLEVLIPVLQNMKQLNGPLVLHVVTQKGHVMRRLSTIRPSIMEFLRLIQARELFRLRMPRLIQKFSAIGFWTLRVRIPASSQLHLR